MRATFPRYSLAVWALGAPAACAGDADEGDPVATSGGPQTGTASTADAGAGAAGTGSSAGCGLQTYYVDADADGFGDPAAPIEACSAPEGHVDRADDCDDGDMDVNPDAQEICDGVDNDCDDMTDDPVCDSCVWTTDPGRGREYGLCATLTWPAAEAFCELQGAQLTGIEDAQENLYLINVLGPVLDAWIGLSDTAREGTFTWVDGTPYGYENWVMGQPDDATGDEDCGAIGPTRRWSDLECDTELPFVCERAAP